MPFLRDRSTRRIMHLTLFALLGLYCGPEPAHAAEQSKADPDVLASGFLVEHPGVRYFKSQDRITRIYGRVFGGGDTPEQAAQAFVQKHIRMFGIQPADLHAKSNLHDERHVQPLMYNRETGEYKFTLVYFTQHFNGVPVFRADVRLLARNEPGHPLVLAAANLKDLRSFTATPNPVASENGKLGWALAKEAYSSLMNFTEPERVIWAGVDDMTVQPAVAYVFTGDNRGAVDAMQPVRRLFLADAATGAILYSESLIHRTDVSGNVSGNASEGPGADFCEPEVLSPMPYARVNIGSTQAFGDENGDFVIPNGGNSPVTVQSPVRGQRFVVSNASGSNTVLSMTVTPPGPANFVHNTANTSELIRAEVNAYVQANLVRDAIVAANPSYPQIGSQTNFSVVVNRTDGFCPGNAWYDTSPLSINFCTSGPSNPNTAWSSVVHHEFGHHLVNTGGSGQGAYGEGVGDVMSSVILDDSRLGLGFFNSCSSWLRDADNTLQYPCSGGIHFCGQLLSGCVWDTRNELVSTEPGTYQQILMDLMVNSVLLHSGSGIAPQITTDWLTLDDDDGDLGNGTPHSAEILTGFGAHNMAPVLPPDNDNCTDAIAICPGTPASGNTSGANSNGSSSCGSSGSSPDAWHHYRSGADGTATFSLCGGGTSYDSVLSVHTGCPGSSTNELACDDDFCGVGGPSQVTISVTAGVDYLIRVTGWNGSAGNYTLTVTGPTCGDSTGACCICTGPDQSCEIRTQAECEATPDAEYLGDGEDCFNSTGDQFIFEASGLNLPLLDNGGPQSHTINVPNSEIVQDIDIDLQITHTWVGDLRATVEHNGTTVVLLSQPGDPNDVIGSDFGCSANNYDIILDDEGTGGPIETACANNLSSPPNYTPNDPLSAFDGMDMAGAWRITVEDVEAVGTDEGTLDGWSLHITGQGEPQLKCDAQQCGCNGDPDCDDGDACTTDICDPQGGCLHEFIVCDDDDDCTADSCNPASGCVFDLIDCDDGNACTMDTCNQQGGCLHVDIVCGDDDDCTADSCDPANGCVFDPIDCDDDDACTTDICNPQGGCLHEFIVCDDADDCTADSCDPANGCVFDPIDCDDDDACTSDTCNPQGGCLHEFILCDDSNDCTADSCDSASGCVFDPIDCDDGDACTSDTCNSQGGCLHQGVLCTDKNACTIDGCDPERGCTFDPVVCDDGNACTDDDCDSASGCFATPNSDPCDDGDACTTGDSCSDSNCGGTPVDCSDLDDQCNTGSCNPESGECEAQPSTGDACDDDSACTEADVCTEGVCVGAEVDCNDDNACTVDACDSTDGCTHDAVDCTDENLCTTDSCDPATGCAREPVECPDGEVCDPASGECFGGCVADLDGDGDVDAGDLAILLGAWGPNPGHPADFNGDGTVNAADLALLLGTWGPCA